MHSIFENIYMGKLKQPVQEIRKKKKLNTKTNMLPPHFKPTVTALGGDGVPNAPSCQSEANRDKNFPPKMSCGNCAVIVPIADLFSDYGSFSVISSSLSILPPPPPPPPVLSQPHIPLPHPHSHAPEFHFSIECIT